MSSQDNIDLENGGRFKGDDVQPTRTGSQSKSASQAPLDFSQMLAEAALNPKKPIPLFRDRDPRISIRVLQYMNIVNLRRILAGEVAEIKKKEAATPEQMERIQKTMKDYVGALRDLKYMLETPSQNKNAAKILEGMLYIYKSAILIEGGVIPPKPKCQDLRSEIPDYTGYGGYQDRQEDNKEQTKEFFERLGMALFGGFVLIAPMLIMRLHPTELTTLLTTSVFVLVVGIILAWYMKDATGRDILAATAAYAAVLVVFVGANANG